MQLSLQLFGQDVLDFFFRLREPDSVPADAVVYNNRLDTEVDPEADPDLEVQARFGY